MKTKRKRTCKGIIFLMILLVADNLAGCSSAFCDWYLYHIYPVISDIYTRLTDAIPFPIGEVCMYAGAGLLLLYLLSLLSWIIFIKRKGYVNYLKGYTKFVCVTAFIVLNLYTFLWVIPIRSTPMTVTGSDMEEGKLEELTQIYVLMVKETNRLCDEVERGMDGNVVYPDQEGLQNLVIEAMKKEGQTNARLSGYYPHIKTAWCSDVLDWMSIGGFTYPFTMEVTINRYVDSLYYPTLCAHELAHHKGYYLEDEGTFISYLVGIHSDSALLGYSAYTSTLPYVVSDIKKAMKATMTEEEMEAFKKDLPSVRQQVIDDMNYAEELAKKGYEEEEHPLQQYEQTAEKAADTGWKVQTNLLKEYTYSGVVRHLLEYYKDEF